MLYYYLQHMAKPEFDVPIMDKQQAKFKPQYRKDKKISLNTTDKKKKHLFQLQTQGRIQIDTVIGKQEQLLK